MLFNLPKGGEKEGGKEGRISNAETGAANRPQCENAVAGGDPSSALFQRGLCCDIGLTFPELDGFFKGLLPKRAVFVLTDSLHVFELELVETSWLLRHNLIDVRIAASKGR